MTLDRLKRRTSFGLVSSILLVVAMHSDTNPAEAASCTVTVANLSSAAVQAAINAAGHGDVVCLPAGRAEWTTSVVLAKPIVLQGAGAGGYVGRSATPLPISLGVKTFDTQAGLTFRIGESITARHTNRGGLYAMNGTVISYAGTTLAIDVTSVDGGGTFAAWVLERPSQTTIVNSAVSTASEGLLRVTESPAGSVDISGIRFETGRGSLGWHITIAGSPGGRPVLIHGNWFSATGAPLGGILSDVNRGVVYSNSFNGTLCSAAALGCAPYANGAVTVKNVNLSDSWSQRSTMGAADTDGAQNFYVEDNYFLAFWQALGVTDSGARAVIRHNVMHDSALGSHGADTEALGARHWEIYDNEFVQTDMGGDPYNLNWWFLARGGTGVITDNLIANIDSPGYWGDKPEFIFTIQVLQRNVNAYYSCWGANIPGPQYPAPRQVGFGFVKGTGGTDEIGLYKGDSEPVYVWGNTGTYRIVTSDYGGRDCANPDSTSDYFIAGRDYFWNAGAKPGYTKFTYPHPLRQGRTPAPPTNISIKR